MSETSERAAVVTSWALFCGVEAWFVHQGGRLPTAEAVALEAVVVVAAAYGQARVLPAGLARSPAWAGLLPVAWTAAMLGPPGLAAVPYALGCLAIAVAAARLASALLPAWGWAVAAPLLGGLGVRALVWSWSPGASERQTSVDASWASALRREVAWPSTPPTPASEGPPVVLITVDTLRADAAASMVGLARVADGGRRFDTALSTSSWTVPAMASVMTGRTPAGHGAGVGPDGALHGIDAGVTTLAEALTEQGYVAAAFATNAWLKPGLGFERGFARYDHADLRRPHRLLASGFPPGRAPRDAEAVVDRALAWVGTQGDGRGRLLWVHLLDPHLPWLHDGAAGGWTDERLRSGMRLDAATEAAIRAGYAAEVAVADAAIVRLLDGLASAGWSDAVVALTADHGEEWWDHGSTGHGHQHHAEVVRVPMALRGPGVSPGVEGSPVQLADLATTLAALAGAALGDGARLDGAIPADRVVTTVGNAYFRAERSAWGQGMHAIGRLDGAARCYALDVDPGEQQSLPCPSGAVLDAWSSASLGAGAAAAVDRAALRALGYVE